MKVVDEQSSFAVPTIFFSEKLILDISLKGNLFQSLCAKQNESAP